jgi:hypothetical protein
MLGIDYLAYCLGVRDKASLSIVQGVVLCVLGFCLAYGIITERIRFGLGLALISLYSVIFLYHRVYDAVMIAPALVYAISQTRRCHGWRRVSFSAATIMMMIVIYMNRDIMTNVRTYVVANHNVLSRISELVLLPYATWLILGSIAILFLTDRSDTAKKLQGSFHE